MALRSLASELLSSLNVYEYHKYIPAVHAGTGVTETMFAKMAESADYTIDTSRTYKGKRSKVLNPNLMFEIFGIYNGEGADVVRAMMLKWIRDNQQSFDSAIGLSMIGKDIELESWMINMSSSRTPGDEFALYALCKLYSRHACIVNTGRLWHTCSAEGLPDDKTIKEICDLRFIQIHRDAYALLRPKTGKPGYMADQVIAEGSVIGMIRKVEAGEIKLPLGTHNQELPEETKFPILPLPLPYELDSGEKIKIPQDPPEVVVLDGTTPQRVEKATVSTPPEETPVPVLMEVPKTIPCVIKIRKLTDMDVNLWKPKSTAVPTPPKPLPDETESDNVEDPVPDDAPPKNSGPTPSVRLVAGYGLRNRPKPVRTNRTGMARASKDKVSFAGVFSTDESSQDSRMPVNEGEFEEDDSPPLVKITGLSEPSPYRLAAQKFIQAQRMGLAPPPPNQSLPGLKVRSPSHSEDGQDDTDVSSSDSTVIYEPPKCASSRLPDETKDEDDVKTPVRRRVVIGFRTYGIRKPKLNTKTRKFRCVKCKNLFNSVANLNKHFIERHRRLKCIQCGKEFSKPRSYEKHKYAHVSKPHKCDDCGKGFTFQSHLQTHLLSHAPPKQFMCSKRNCDRGYSTKSDLRKHEKTHTAKIIKCKYEGCIYKTKDPRNYSTHLKTHTQKKNHWCSYCGKGFTHSNQLTRHKKSCIKVKRSDSPTF